MPKVRKAELSILYMTCHLILFYISIKYHQNITKGIQVTERTQNLFQTKQGNNSNSKKASVVILVCDMSSHPILHFYQVSSKYSKGYSSYRVDKKFYTDVDADGIRPKNNVPPPFGPTVYARFDDCRSYGQSEIELTARIDAKKLSL